LCLAHYASAQHKDADASHQCQANEYYQKINNIPFSDYYGGSYISAKGKWIVYITGDQIKGRKSVAKQVGSNNFIAITGKYSFKTLTKNMDELNAFVLNKANDSVIGNINAFCLREDKNRIEMELGEYTEEKIQEFKSKVMNSPAIVFKKSAGRNQDSSPLKKDTSLKELVLSIEPKIFTSRNIGTAKVVLTNNTKDQILTGDHYFVERYDGKIWKKLKFFDGLAFYDIGYRVTPLNSKEFIVNLNPVSYNYAPGRYRVVKDVYVSRKKNFVTAEFIVESDPLDKLISAKIESKLKAEDFTLSIKPKTFKNSTMGKAKLVIANNTNEKALAGLQYFVDVYQDNNWKRLKFTEYIFWDLISIELKRLSSRELDVNLKSLPYTNKIQPYNYKPGRYRIIKEIISLDKKRHFISTEFTVK
jgi:hypothetical protein